MKRRPSFAEIDSLKRQWTNKYVVVDESRPELKRFAGKVGQVITVNMNGKCLVLFEEGWGRYDIDPAFLRVVSPPVEKARAQAS
jgi:hypothetical protein